MDPPLSPDFEAARRHCEAAWPEEGVCAYVAASDGFRFVPLTNVAARAHADDPLAHPSGPRTSFAVDPREWMALERSALDAEVWLVHSHVDAPATLSAWDRQTFTVDGRPLLPRLRLAVLSVRAGRSTELVTFAFADGAWQPCSGN